MHATPRNLGYIIHLRKIIIRYRLFKCVLTRTGQNYTHTIKNLNIRLSSAIPNEWQSELHVSFSLKLAIDSSDLGVH